MSEQEVAMQIRREYGSTAEFKPADYKAILQIILVNHPLAFGGLSDVIEKQYVRKPMGNKVYRNYILTEEKIYFIYSDVEVVSPSAVSDELVHTPAFRNHFNEEDFDLLAKRLLKY